MWSNNQCSSPIYVLCIGNICIWPLSKSTWWIPPMETSHLITVWSLKCNSAADVASSKHWHVSSLEWDSWTKMVLQPSLAGIHSFHEGIPCCLNLKKNTILLQKHLSNKLLWNGVVHCLNSTSWNRLMTLHPTHPSLHVGSDKIPGMCSTPCCLIKKGAPNKWEIIVYMTNYELHWKYSTQIGSGESGNLQGFHGIPANSTGQNSSKHHSRMTFLLGWSVGSMKWRLQKTYHGLGQFTVNSYQQQNYNKKQDQ